MVLFFYVLVCVGFGLGFGLGLYTGSQPEVYNTLRVVKYVYPFYKVMLWEKIRGGCCCFRKKNSENHPVHRLRGPSKSMMFIQPNLS